MWKVIYVLIQTYLLRRVFDCLFSIMIVNIIFIVISVVRLVINVVDVVGVVFIASCLC